MLGIMKSGKLKQGAGQEIVTLFRKSADQWHTSVPFKNFKFYLGQNYETFMLKEACWLLKLSESSHPRGIEKSFVLATLVQIGLFH